jgi:hypothetical protein
MYLSASEIKQLEILGRKKPVERFLIMLDLIEGQLEAMRAGIRHQNPAFSDEEVELCLRQRITKTYSPKH